MSTSDSTRDAGGDTGHSVDIVEVTKTFANVTAVHMVSLDIRKGEFVTLLGPSGCGKTTLLNMVAGFEAQTSGTIHIDGKDISAVPPYMRETGMVFQSYALFPHMNVFDNIAFGLRMRKLPAAEIRAEVERALDMMKLSGMEGRRVRQLSGGQQQRIALARAIVIRPKVLLLDEPLSALDKNLRLQMQVELKELHQKTGLTTLFVTHDQGEALSLSDRVVVMNRGEVQQVSAPIELYTQPANGFVASFIGEINALPKARCRVSGEALRFEVAPGLSLEGRQPARQKLMDGQMVHIFIRPEHIEIAEPLSGGINILKGSVTAHIYQGTHTQTRVDVPGIGLIELRTKGASAIDKAPLGSQIVLSAPLDEAVILPA
ncbi:MAG: ABC transporter ATP-binding protein [Parvibaculaceae bacterium]